MTFPLVATTLRRLRELGEACGTIMTCDLDGRACQEWVYWVPRRGMRSAMQMNGNFGISS